jgi:indolepyruvate ferredoxin oxidoreductase beta subunit
VTQGKAKNRSYGFFLYGLASMQEIKRRNSQMAQNRLSKDPYNLIITGVGGQGNVMASRVLGNMMVRKGFRVTIGETFGASQRGGSVMSHLRISENGNWSPQIPEGQADFIIALEPSEAVRLISRFGNPEVKVLSNTRPIHPVEVIAGDVTYPTVEEIISSVEALVARAWFIAATEEAMKMGNPIFGNIIVLGALAATESLPMDRDDFMAVIEESFAKNTIDANIKAYDLGIELAKQ